MTNAEILIQYVSRVVNHWTFHFDDICDLMTARKERIWIKEPPKSRCGFDCMVAPKVQQSLLDHMTRLNEFVEARRSQTMRKIVEFHS